LPPPYANGSLDSPIVGNLSINEVLASNRTIAVNGVF
jgi:hypothetical protein